MNLQERLILFTGHFGSGKTELAVNTALNVAEQGRNTILVDIDIVNPFFRSSEVKEILEGRGIRVLAPAFAGTTSDVPALPADIYGVFSDSAQVIFDVGGDETGARALGRFTPYFAKEPYRMFYCINARRPLSADARDILEMLALIQAKSRLSVTDLINNTNLSYETEVQDVMDGQRITEEVSQTLGLPIAYVSGLPELAKALPEALQRKFYPIQRFMKSKWF